MSKPTSVIRSKQAVTLTVLILSLLIISSVSLLIYTFKQSKESKSIAVQQYSNSAVEKITNSFTDFLPSVQGNMKLLGDWAEDGLFDYLSEKEYILFFSPLVKQLDHLGFISLSFSGEQEYIFSDQEGYTVFRKFNEEQDSALIEYRIDSAGNILEERKIYVDSGFHIQRKQLFKDELKYDSIYLSGVRSFHEIEALGISEQLFIKSKSSGKIMRISFGIRLEDVASFFDNQDIGNNSQVFLFHPSGKTFREDRPVIAPGSVDPSYYLQDIDSMDPIPETAGIMHWMKHKADSSGVFSFKFQKEKWHGHFFPLNEENKSRGYWVAIIIPDSSIDDPYKTLQISLFTGLILILLASVTAVILLVKRIRNKQNMFLPDLNTLKNETVFSELIDKGERPYLEFKSTIRYNIHAAKPGKEIELAWLKGVVAFLNTEGGILLIGVQDDGTITGLENDNFANEDKCLLHVQNLLKQHIGIEFSTYINFEIILYNKQKVLALECYPSKQPAFLKHNEKETFYVRSGPSSIELPVSKIMQYLAERAKGRG